MAFWRQDLRAALLEEPLYHALRRAHHAPWRALWDSCRLHPRILRSAPLRSAPPASAGWALHTMVQPADWRLSLWMLRSLLRFCPEPPALVVHLNRALRPSARHHLARLLPDARIVDRAAADPVVNAHLLERRLIQCLHWRHSNPILLKLLDSHVLAGAERLVWVDPDVLFFRAPAELLAAAGPGRLDRFLCQQDVASSYTPEPAHVLARTGVALRPRVNSGLLLRDHDGLSLDDVETFLQTETWPSPRSGFLEQTAFAYCLSRHPGGGFLPSGYHIGLQARPEPVDMVCRHYAGPTRGWISDGMRRLLREGLLAGR
jgi:hypothetical protein